MAYYMVFSHKKVMSFYFPSNLLPVDVVLLRSSGITLKFNFKFQFINHYRFYFVYLFPFQTRIFKLEFCIRIKYVAEGQ